MLLVETYLALSPERGLGLFAKHNINAGTIYWTRNEVFDKIISPEDMASLSELAQEYINRYACLEINGNWYLCGDNARFSNHSDNPNSQALFNEDRLTQSLLAIRNIKKGEEIFCNYTEICQTCIDGISF